MTQNLKEKLTTPSPGPGSSLSLSVKRQVGFDFWDARPVVLGSYMRSDFGVDGRSVVLVQGFLSVNYEGLSRIFN